MYIRTTIEIHKIKYTGKLKFLFVMDINQLIINQHLLWLVSEICQMRTSRYVSVCILFIRIMCTYGTAYMQRHTCAHESIASQLKNRYLKGRVAPISFASVHPVSRGMNTHERDGCHAPLISIFNQFAIDSCERVRRCMWAVPYVLDNTLMPVLQLLVHTQYNRNICTHYSVVQQWLPARKHQVTQKG